MDAGKQNMLLYAGVAAIVIVSVGYLLYSGVGTTSALVNASVGSQELFQLSSVANNATLASQVGITAYAGVAPATYFTKINGSEIYNGSKPELLYVGADFCPYCAASRWPIILALMRFGNVTGIRYMESSSTDVYASTPTFTFYPNYSYSSKYLSFVAFETESRTSQPLQKLGNYSEAVYYKYGTAIPFFDFMNHSISQGSIVPPGILKGLSWTQITSELSSPNTEVSQSIVGAANLYTAEICLNINNTAPVCSMGYVKSVESKIA